MIPVKHIDPEDLPLYAMQLLPPDEEEELTLHLQHSPEARRVLAEIYGDLALYAHTADPEDPAPSVREQFLAAVALEPKPVPIDLQRAAAPAAAAEPEPYPDTYTPRLASFAAAEEPAPRSAAARVLPWLGWAAAAVLALATVRLWQQREGLTHALAAAQQEANHSDALSRQALDVLQAIKSPAAENVVLTGSDAPAPPQGRASYDATRGSLVFFASNLTPLDPGKTYELWLIPANGNDPIPAGTFHPDTHGSAAVLLPTLPKGVPAKAFGVTIEDEGGATVPTKPILLKGQV